MQTHLSITAARVSNASPFLPSLFLNEFLNQTFLTSAAGKATLKPSASGRASSLSLSFLKNQNITITANNLTNNGYNPQVYSRTIYYSNWGSGSDIIYPERQEDYPAFIKAGGAIFATILHQINNSTIAQNTANSVISQSNIIKGVRFIP